MGGTTSTRKSSELRIPFFATPPLQIEDSQPRPGDSGQALETFKKNHNLVHEVLALGQDSEELAKRMYKSQIDIKEEFEDENHILQNCSTPLSLVDEEEAKRLFDVLKQNNESEEADYKEDGKWYKKEKII